MLPTQIISSVCILPFLMCLKPTFLQTQIILVSSQEVDLDLLRTGQMCTPRLPGPKPPKPPLPQFPESKKIVSLHSTLSSVLSALHQV